MKPLSEQSEDVLYVQPEKLQVGDTVLIREGYVLAGEFGLITAITRDGIKVEIVDAVWTYAESALDFISHSIQYLWHELRRLTYEKGYTYYCGYNGCNIAILGHPDGGTTVWTGNSDGLTHALLWIQQAPNGLSEDERMELSATHWAERQAIERSYPDIPEPDYEDSPGNENDTNDFDVAPIVWESYEILEHRFEE